jgi:hypothetical protein
MPRISSTLKAFAVVLALSAAGAGSAHAASTVSGAASERWVRANLAANPGSVRVGPNRIRLEPGLTMGLHGRGSARAAASRASGCKYLYFCLYENPYFGGASFGMSQCRIYNLRQHRFFDLHGRWDTWDNEASSWINDQSGGVQAILFELPGGAGASFRTRAPQDPDMRPGRDDVVDSVKPC